MDTFYISVFELFKGVVILLTYLLHHYGISDFPSQVISVVKKIVGMTKSTKLLQTFANGISWSQNENDAANVALLPFIITGAGHGTMAVKVLYTVIFSVLKEYLCLECI